MPRFISKDGSVTVETSVPREAVQLRAEGFHETKARTVAVREADGVKPEAPKSSK